MDSLPPVSEIGPEGARGEINYRRCARPFMLSEEEGKEGAIGKTARFCRPPIACLRWKRGGATDVPLG